MATRKLKSTQPKLNVRLLRRIQKHILEEPRRFMMVASNFVATTQEQWHCFRRHLFSDASEIMTPCGTAACIAGWANILTGVNPRSFKAGDPQRAAVQIGITPSPLWSKSNLFVIENWPEPFCSRYKKAKTSRVRVKIACKRIDHLIKTGE